MPGLPESQRVHLLRLTWAAGSLALRALLAAAHSRTMKSLTEYLTFNLPARMAFENITPKVEQIVKKSGVVEGIVLVNAKRTALLTRISPCRSRA
jgi:hypothetical protein